jgi:peptidylprolyl isomerase
MAQAKQGDTVKVHYIGKLADGSTFDNSHDQEPLEFTIGAGQVLPGFEGAVLGMEPGESKTLTIPSDDAYGAYDDEMLMEVDRSQLPSKIEPQVGQQLQVRQPDGETFSVIVAEIETETVTLDANHPLAGKDLTFEIMLVSIA